MDNDMTTLTIVCGMRDEEMSRSGVFLRALPYPSREATNESSPAL